MKLGTGLMPGCAGQLSRPASVARSKAGRASGGAWAAEAGALGVLHGVGDGVDAGLRGTAVPAGVGGALEGRQCLGRRVGHVVTRPVAAALEGVEEPQPVTDLVDQGVALVVGRNRAPRHRLVE